MTHDTTNKPADRTFGYALPGGHQSPRECWGCKGRFNNTTGGARIGPLKLWHCGACRTAKKARAA
jgi:hypothetical protein